MNGEVEEIKNSTHNEMTHARAMWDKCELQNRLLQYHIEIQIDICIIVALPPIRLSLNERCPSVRRSELLRPSSLLHRSPLSYC